jgi:hypothetical protein
MYPCGPVVAMLRERERDFSTGNDGKWTHGCRGQKPISNDEEEKALEDGRILAL